MQGSIKVQSQRYEQSKFPSGLLVNLMLATLTMAMAMVMMESEKRPRIANFLAHRIWVFHSKMAGRDMTKVIGLEVRDHNFSGGVKVNQLGCVLRKSVKMSSAQFASSVLITKLIEDSVLHCCSMSSRGPTRQL